VLSIPQSKPADELLEELRSAEYPIAVVLDEYGGTAGIITLHDLFEGLVGPVTAGGRALEIGPAEADGSRVVDGLARLDELAEATGMQIPGDDREHADSVTGLFMYRLGHIPKAGDRIEVDGWTLKVEAVARRRVARARVIPPKS
jgi:CBS domain containing-hemolysin-like protein